MQASTLPPLFAELPPEIRQIYDPVAPWDLLGAGLDRLLEALPSSAIESPLSPEVHLLGDRIVIGPGARIHPGALIEGPIRIGRDVVIRTGAYLRGGNWIGDGCVVGANTEVKRSVFLDGAKAPHLSYVGDSILGRGVNLGAGSVLSNLRHDGRQVQIPFDESNLETGRRKLGAILGDGVLTGCNCVLYPGVVVGKSSQIYPGVQLRSGVYPAGCLVKLRQQLEIVELRTE
jgi:NDP-sugar pyrophosphorylase family protein